ncbi:hypothetical protein [Clostridium formicaceticum]|uniref:Uncharacterized protein n=1 Tax=Clostridium formicaceticum TaxID=1497 RepID=A0AAC9WGY8_9CLOT|nr:hypothetical protein [Clostridium formicaceticum]AOY77775.1 hypothetical protein BJL90_19065 [Clostridium formicaceticum]ARE88381.1 hypothetical protein CLFO_27830 [Clostridium formicaceticum]
MPGKLVSVNEIMRAIACFKGAYKYLSDLPYHTLYIYETLSIDGFDKANKLVIKILKEYRTIHSTMKSIELLNISPEFNDNASIIMYAAEQNLDYFLGVLTQLKKGEEKFVSMTTKKKRG